MEKEVIVKIEACGICHTDEAIRVQDLPVRLPLVMGHEGIGTIHELGDNTEGHLVGERVLLGFDSCGSCNQCEKTQVHRCKDFMKINIFGDMDSANPSFCYEDSKEQINGSFCGQSAFATYVVVKEKNVIKIQMIYLLNT